MLDRQCYNSGVALWPALLNFLVEVVYSCFWGGFLSLPGERNMEGALSEYHLLRVFYQAILAITRVIDLYLQDEQ